MIVGSKAIWGCDIVELDSYNSFNDKLSYAQVEERYYRVDQETLTCDGTNYYNEKDICEELEEILNQNKDE